MTSNTTRHQLKRQLAQCLNALDRVNHHLGSVFIEFEGHTSGLDEYLKQMMTSSVQQQEHILKFWELAWGKRPENFNKWR